MSLLQTAYNVYGSLPVLMQNAAISCWGSYSRYQRYGGSFQRCVEDLRRSEWWSAEEISAYQLRHLQRILTQAGQHVPFYRRLFAQVGFSPSKLQSLEDLHRLPVLKKEVVRGNTAALRSQSTRHGSLRTSATSGTTGSPLKIIMTPHAYELMWAVAWRHRARFGLRLGDPLLSFGIRMPIRSQRYRPPVWRENWAINQTYVSADHITPETLPSIVDMMNGRRFLIFQGYPSAMYQVARYILGAGHRLVHRPAMVMSASEALSEEQTATFERAFGARVSELYGMGEGAGGMSKCEAGRFHEDFELGIVEFVPDHSLGDDELRRIIVTSLHNSAMPLIRYDTGDVARIARDPCPCGRASQSATTLVGRMHEFVRTPAGRYVVDMNQVFKVASGVREGHIVQSGPGSIKVLVVPTKEFDASENFRLLEAQIRRRVGGDMSIEFACVTNIARRANGKAANVWKAIPTA